MLKEITANAITGRKLVRPVVGEETLVHDGKQIIGRHGPESVTASGNPAIKILVGTKLEIDDEIKRLGLVAP